MQEAQRVQELVLHGGQAVAVPADGQPLLPHAAVPNGGGATVHRPQTERESFFTLSMSSMSSSELCFMSFHLFIIHSWSWLLFMMKCYDVIIINNYLKTIMKHYVMHLNWIFKYVRIIKLLTDTLMCLNIEYIIFN